MAAEMVKTSTFTGRFYLVAESTFTPLAFERLKRLLLEDGDVESLKKAFLAARPEEAWNP